MPKSNGYSGLLAKPQRICTPADALSADALAFARRWGVSESSWREAVAVSERLDRAEFDERIAALIEYFDIDRTCPGWERDLALSLASKHEPDFFRDNKFRLAALFKSHKVLPDSPGSDLVLALKLATKHIPGFGFMLVARQRSRFKSHEICLLFFAQMKVQQYLENQRRKVSDRALASIFLDKTALVGILGAKLADHIRHILDSCGNTRRGRNGPHNTISDKRLRQIFAELRKARHAFRSGKCTPLQAEFVMEAVPMLFRHLDGPKN